MYRRWWFAAEGARLILLQPIIIRASARKGAPRRVRLALMRKLRLRLVAERRAAIELWAWTALVVWMSSPLQLFLSHVDPTSPAAAQGATPLYRYARYACALIPIAVLLHRREAALRLGRTAWPLFALLAYAAASCSWSQDQAASIQGLLAGAPTLATAAALAVALRPGRVAQVLLQALGVATVGSVVAVLLLPHYAIAGAHDVLGASTPGDWRGLYGHKNTLGHVAGLAVGVLASSRGRLVRPPGLRWLGLAAALACVVASRSASGLALAAALPVLDQVRLHVRGTARLALAGFGLAALAAAFAGRAMILAAGLAAMGRDATLSGRTAIWRAAAELVRLHMLGGWGLNYSVSAEVAERLTALFGVNHVHNALLDVVINLGGLGAALLVLAVAGALATAIRPGSRSAARGALGLLAVGWLLSGLTEDMAVRADGPVAQFGLCALFGLYGLRAGRASFRRPRFGFHPAWRAPLRPSRLERRAMRIALLASGFADYSLELAGALAEGHEVVVLADAEALNRERGEAPSPAGVEVRRFSQDGLLRRWGAVAPLASALARWRPDAILAHEHPHPHLSLLQTLAARIAPLGLIVHDPEPHPGRDGDFARRRTRDIAVQRALARHLFAHGRTCATRLEQASGRPVTCIGHGPILRPLAPPQPPPARVVC